MNEDQAIQRLQALTSEDDREAVATALPLDLMEAALAVQARVLDGQEPEDGEVEAAKRVLLRLHADLEAIERDIIRFLKWESTAGRTWEQVASEFGGMYAGKGGAFARWKQLTKTESRVTTRNMSRGQASRRKQGSDATSK